MDDEEVQREIAKAARRLVDLHRAMEAGIHRNELLVSARQTVDVLTCMLDETSRSARPINKLIDQYEKLMGKLLN